MTRPEPSSRIAAALATATARDGAGPREGLHDPPAPTTTAAAARVAPPLLKLRIKRAVDVTVSAALLVLLLPVLAAVALAIRIDSPGPVLFTHVRVGENRRRRVRQGLAERRYRPGLGREFRILKFRTMRSDAPPYAVSPRDPSDARITRVGRFLRRTCLDELPQLVNVLRGEMSLVGPRPEMPFIVAGYDARLRRRLDARPGLTGLWQLRGPRDRAIHESLDLDLAYVENWTLRLDLRILLETVAFALRRKNH